MLDVKGSATISLSDYNRIRDFSRFLKVESKNLRIIAEQLHLLINTIADNYKIDLHIDAFNEAQNSVRIELREDDNYYIKMTKEFHQWLIEEE